MAKKRLLSCTFLIPTRRDANLSDGKPHKAEALRWLEATLFEQFQGWTQPTALRLGCYLDPDTNEAICDESREYTVAVPSNRIKELRQLLAEACGVFQQKCIYLCVAGEVEFIEASHGSTR